MPSSGKRGQAGFLFYSSAKHLRGGNNPVFVFGSLLEQARFTQQNFRLSALNNPDPLSNFRTAITLRQTLFDQLQTYTRVTQARLGQQQADLQKAMVEQQVRFEVDPRLLRGSRCPCQKGMWQRKR